MASLLPEPVLPVPGFPDRDRFSEDELQTFSDNGFVICRKLAPPEVCERMLTASVDHLTRRVAPLEFEAEVEYPGSPRSLNSSGGGTVRRLKQAHSRDIVFTEWAGSHQLQPRLQQLLGPAVVMPLAHHNCVMTKQPEFSSDTGWHRDIRYWSFQRPELVSVWLALGHEHPENGGLFLIPGSHRIELGPGQLDERHFIRADIPANQSLLKQRQAVELEAGDVLFFHACTLHEASRNFTAETKYSSVFTFRPADNLPVPDSRSCAPELLLSRQ